MDVTQVVDLALGVFGLVAIFALFIYAVTRSSRH
jgi:hypothetical protein